MSNTGYIFETDKGEKAYSLHREQLKEFVQKNKILIHLTRDGKDIKVLKDMDKLKLIGFQD